MHLEWSVTRCFIATAFLRYLEYANTIVQENKEGQEVSGTYWHLVYIRGDNLLDKKKSRPQESKQ
jgi:hypothetical protein